MTSLKEAIGRILRGQRSEPDLPDPNFDYRVFWTEQAMAWAPERQKIILAAIRTLKQQTDFSPAQSDRRYLVDGLSEERYSGGSLLALETVLAAILNEEKNGSIDERKS